MRIIFAGTPAFAAAALRALLNAGHDIPLVLTQPDRPAGRGLKPQPSAVKTLALSEGLPLAQPTSLRDAGELARLAQVGADIMVVAAYGLILPEAVLRIPPHGCVNIPASLLPEGSGGMLPALFLWRRLAAAGPEKFGDVYYLGTAPWPGRPELADVLVGIHAGAECHFYFDAKEGLLLGLELYAAPANDPCEIYFLDYRETNGHWFPQRLEVRYGEIVFADLKIDRFSQEKLPEHGSSP